MQFVRWSILLSKAGPKHGTCALHHILSLPHKSIFFFLYFFFSCRHNFSELMLFLVLCLPFVTLQTLSHSHVLNLKCEHFLQIFAQPLSLLFSPMCCFVSLVHTLLVAETETILLYLEFSVHILLCSDRCLKPDS